MILAIHGGGWRRLDKREYGPRIASAFVPNDYVVVVAELSPVLAGKPEGADKPRGPRDRCALGQAQRRHLQYRCGPDCGHG